MPPLLHFVVPGPLDQRTGGYIYDRRIIDGLREDGWQVQVHELAGRFPRADREAREAAAQATRLMAGGLAVVDGLALPAFAGTSRDLPSPWVGLIHHPLSLETGLDPQSAEDFAAIERPLMREASRLIVTSPRTRIELEKSFGVDRRRVIVVTPGVDPAPLAKGGGDQGSLALLSIGTLTPRKGHELLIEALSSLKSLGWTLTIVGSDRWDPACAARIREAIGRHGLMGRVTIVDEQDEAGLQRFYHCADVFVLASHYEGYGMVLSEALARGLPIVSTLAGAVPDTVPPDAGLLVPPGEVAPLAAALERIMTRPGVRHGLAAGARAARQRQAGWQEAAAAFGATLAEAKR